MATFKPTYAVDTNGIPVADERGVIFDLDDTEGEFPLQVTDPGEIPMAAVSITEAGVSQAFVVEDRTQVLWISENGDRHVILESLDAMEDRKSTRLNSSHVSNSYAVFCLKKKIYKHSDIKIIPIKRFIIIQIQILLLCIYEYYNV